jgi:hypothetical protein
MKIKRSTERAESVKYANDRAKETDEGSGSDDACQIGQTALHFDADCRARPSHPSFDGLENFSVGARARRQQVTPAKPADSRLRDTGPARGVPRTVLPDFGVEGHGGSGAAGTDREAPSGERIFSSALKFQGDPRRYRAQCYVTDGLTFPSYEQRCQSGRGVGLQSRS